ncbi:MAG: aspartate kinase [Myxococcota bacterium]|nr:aspartate kinase [Myxococcota bacterium]
MNKKLKVRVFKFGGSSLSSAERIVAAVGLVEAGLRTSNVITVTSAMGGTTDRLSHLASSGVSSTEWGRTVDSLSDQYLDVVTRLELADFYRNRVSQLLDRLRSLYPQQGPTDSESRRDEIMGFGERLTAPLFAGRLAKTASGSNAALLDGTDFFLTDANFTDAWLVKDETYAAVSRALEPHLVPARPVVVTGYCGRTHLGVPTTLGRGGSDSTATVIARAVNAESVTLWSDVPGVMTADPRRVGDARTLPHLSYGEAAELSFYGAKVLHPRAMQPVSEGCIPVLCKSTFAPNEQGTLIDSRGPGGVDPVKACSLESGYRSMSIIGPGMVGLSGVAAQVLAALAAVEINVVMLSQACSELALTVVVRGKDSDRARRALEAACERDVLKDASASLRLRPEPISLIAAVGADMARVPGVAGRFMTALGKAKVNVVAISQADTELNITAAIESQSGDVALQAIHEEFGLGRRPTINANQQGCDLLLLGMGQISTKFVGLVQDQIRSGVGLNIVAVADTSGFLFRPPGVDPAELNSAYFGKKEGRQLKSLGHVVDGDSESLIRKALQYRLNSPIVVDMTADCGLADALVTAKRLGAHVVSANKAPFAGSISQFNDLFEGQGMTCIEATVGAGLPVIDTLRSLRDTGDSVQLIEGCFSGTLGYIMTRVEEGISLSKAVLEALDYGYTEPDPAIDLSGLDVFRKAVILARVAGWIPGQSADDCRPFIADLGTGLPKQVLMRRIEGQNSVFAKSVEAAASRGSRLRYVATVDPTGVKVGLKELDGTHPLAQLKGTDNMVVFSTARYSERPLAIMGPGAGPDVTAMGVMADVLRIIRQSRVTYA